jgi:NAD(P)-dependent dehydrogenase (short-subunit alcohol dehydrogenase family)
VTNFDLTGRTALVTGGARGIGAGIAESLVKAGARVMIGDVSDELGRATAQSIAASTGGKLAFVRMDVTQDEDWTRATAETIHTFGGFDILVNNAGIEVTALLVDTNAADIRRMLDVNIIGTMLGIKHAFRAMRPEGPAGAGGSIVNISSVAATIAFPAISGYSATKSAVDRITRIAAVESGKLNYRVRVNCVYPGLVPTEMGIKLAQDISAAGLAPSVEDAVAMVVSLTPLGHLGEVSDMASAVVFLCSDAARFITGAGLPVDGGMGI